MSLIAARAGRGAAIAAAVAFWLAVAASALACALVTLDCRDALRPLFWYAGARDIGEMLLAIAVVLVPVALWGLLAWAVWRPGRRWLRIGRALLPLLLALAVEDRVDDADGLLHAAAFARSPPSVWACAHDPMDGEPAGDLRLIEHHRRDAPEWQVQWPGRAAMAAVGARADRGSIGGSATITWAEPDGRRLRAFVSFSDIVGPHGPEAGGVIAEGGARMRGHKLIGDSLAHIGCTPTADSPPPPPPPPL